MARDSGHTALEIVFVVAVIGLLALAAWRIMPSSGAFAAGYARALVAARVLAVSAASPVAIGRVAQCTGVREVVTPDAPGVMTLAFPPRGLQFTPDGLPRTCDGGGVGNTTILLEHRGRQAAVIVSSLGRVRWELR